MSKNKRKVILIPIIILIVIILGAFSLYQFSFKPKVPVTPITSEIKVDPLEVALKLIPNDLNFSLKEIVTKSNIELSDVDLTNLAILAIQNDPNINDKIEGLKVLIDGKYLNLYIQFKYLNIPLEAKLTFSCFSKNGNGILHYEGGKLGFININKNIIFNNLTSNNAIDVDKDNSDIILKLKDNYNITLNFFEIVNDTLKLGVQTKFKLF